MDAEVDESFVETEPIVDRLVFAELACVVFANAIATGYAMTFRRAPETNLVVAWNSSRNMAQKRCMVEVRRNTVCATEPLT